MISVLQICQFVLTMMEIGMCYAFYDLLVEKNVNYRCEKFVKWIMVICVGGILYCNRVATCFMSNILYVFQSLIMAIPVSFLYKTKYSTSLSITSSYFAAVGLVHVICLMFILLLIDDVKFVNEVYRGTGGWRIVVMLLSAIIVGSFYKLLDKWQQRIIFRIQNIEKVLLVFGFFGCWTIAWGQTQILKLGSRWAIWSLGTLLFVLCIIVGSCYLFYRMLKKDIELTTIQMKIQLLDKYYDDIKKLTENCLYTTHDMKNHILILKKYTDEKNIMKIKEYLDNIGEPIDTMNHYIWSENDTVNLIINTKLEEARNKEITVEAIVDNVTFPMNDNELCSVLANLLDNAVEACEKVDKNSRWIKVSIINEVECFIVKIVNSIGEIPQKNKKYFLSNKSGHMGYGLKSVASIVEKYNGIMKCDFNESAFSVIITFWKAR